MKKFRFFAALCCAVAVLAACDKDNEPANNGQNDNPNNPPVENPDTVPAENPDTLVTAEYTLTVLSSDETLGTVTGSGRYANGTKVAVVALPNGGSEFVSWSDTSSMELEREITLTSDSTITATFRAASGDDGSELTVAEALAMASSLGAGVTTSNEVTVVGYVAKIQAAYSSTYWNISFYMSDDASQRTGANGTDFLAYRVMGTDAANVKVGDKVKVVAKLINYKGNTPETVAGGSVEILWSDPANGHEWVDLGLPSGLKWATLNVGADEYFGWGDYYAWGETEPKSDYSWDTYKHGTSSDNLTKYNATDGKTVLDPEDDVASVNWGGKWRMPTKDEWQELIDNCECKMKIGGCIVTGKNGNSIFLPAAGIYDGSSRVSGGNGEGFYWSSSLKGEIEAFWATTSLEYGLFWLYDARRYGCSIRPVLDEN